MTRFIVCMVWSSGSSVVMSMPASFSRSIGYFELPDPRKVRNRAVADESPAMTLAASASAAVKDVAY